MRIKFIFLVGFLYNGLQLLQAQETPKTLLWRISGNSFAKPCYLYGTMHTGDKRVYYLGDSVYNSISFCDGFALEIDPGDDVDTLLLSLESKGLYVDYKEAVEYNLVKNDPYYKKRKQWELDSAYNKLVQRYKDLSSREIARLRRAYRQRDKNDMNTTFDLYLFDLAKTQGKTVGGLEDIQVHTALTDELGNSFDPDLFLKNQRKKYVDVYEWMVVNYNAAELDKLHDFSKVSRTEKGLSLMLYNRNAIMAQRIDSLGKIRSTFCAVGAAHLPGDSGVINLLRKKGFTVEPVFSSKKIEPGNYKINKKVSQLISISDPDSNYIVQMPGRPTDLTIITDKLFVKTYKELSNEIMLMCGVYEDGNLNKTIEKQVAEIKRSLSWNNTRLYSTKKIYRQGLKGYEMNIKGKDGFMKLDVFYNAGKTYLFGTGSKNKDSLYAARCKNFMATYTMNLNKKVVETESISFVSNDKAFSVALPAQPKKENIAGSVTYTKEDVTLFSSVDRKKKISYLVLLKEPFKGYAHNFDSTIFTQTTTEILKDISVLNQVEENVMLDDHPALKLKIRAWIDNKIHVIYSVMAIRDNRFYSVTARALALPVNEQLFDQFINSFRFLPYRASAFKKHFDRNGVFSTLSPSHFNMLADKPAENNKRTDYYAYDSTTALSYGVTALGLDKYYWASDKTSLLNDYARFNFNDSLAVKNVFGSDSLLYKKNVFNGDIEGRELLLKKLLSNSYSRIRILPYGDSVFILNVKADKALVTNNNADSFFNSFRFTKENFNSTAFTSKTDLFIKDLQSADNTVYKPALEALQDGFRYPAKDLNKILNAFQYDYTNAANSKWVVPMLLSKTLAAYTGNELLAYIKANYPLFKGKREDMRMLLINVLSACNNNQAYQMLKGFLLNDTPANADYEIMLANLKKIPGEASTLFPDMAVKLKDERLGPVVLDLANTLIDSNKIEYSILAAYEDDMLRIGKKLLRNYQKNNSETFNPPHRDAVIAMLARIKTKASKSILKDLLELQIYNLSAVVMLSMVNNNQAVSTNLLDWYCKDPKRRIELYDEFLKAKKQSFFKGEYANQQSFANAFANTYTSERVAENTPLFFDLAAIKDVVIKNEPARFYIYKVTCQFRRGTETFTCIIGAFSTDPGVYSIKEGKEFYILHNKPLNAGNIDKIFNDYIEQLK